MPLRDHFRPPLNLLSSWEEVHGQWPAVIVQQPGKLLPPQYLQTSADCNMNSQAIDHVILNGILLTVRYEICETDISAVRAIVESTGFFHPPEVDVAVELVEERLRRGEASGYYFAFVEKNHQPIAYVCYGPIACTASSFDVYWIAVHHDEQKHGIGRWLMTLSENLIRSQSGQRIYVETSGRADYLPTRKFYDRCGYENIAELPEFYGEGDSKIIYLKVL